jgi:AbrB family looped-hinge helix DNA binding protein
MRNKRIFREAGCSWRDLTAGDRSGSRYHSDAMPGPAGAAGEPAGSACFGLCKSCHQQSSTLHSLDTGFSKPGAAVSASRSRRINYLESSFQKLLPFSIELIVALRIAYRWSKCTLNRVTISPKFQVVIPRQIREAMKLFPGQKMQVIMYGSRIELVLERDVKSMRGFLKGMDTSFKWDEDRL